MKFKVKDFVIVLTGKDRGKTGAITRILREKNQVVIEGINKKIRHAKGRDGQAGERIEFFAPIDASNCAILDANGKPSRIGYKIDDGKKIRIAKTTGGEIVAPKKVSAKPKTAKK